MKIRHFGIWIVFGFLTLSTSLLAQSSPIGYPDTSVCTNAGSGGSPGSTPTTPGRWWNPKRSGTGWDVFYTSNSTNLGLVWYTFDTNRRPVWYMTSFLPINAGQYWSSDLHRRTWIGAGINPAVDVVGHVAVTRIPGDPERMAIRWKLGSAAHQDECIQDYRIEGRWTNPNSTFSGLWHEPNYSGYGVMTSIFNRSGLYTEFVALTTYDTSNQPVWLLAQSPNEQQVPAERTLNFEYIYSNYPGGIPTSDCTHINCVSKELNFGTYYRNFDTHTSAAWSIQVLNKQSINTLQTINWLRPVGPGTVAASKLNDATQVITNRLACTIPEGQPTCAIVVDFGVDPAHGGFGVLFRRNVDNQSLRNLSQGTHGTIHDSLPPGKFRYELRTNTSPTSALLASSALVTISEPAPVAINQIGFPDPAICSTSGSGTGSTVPATPGLWWNPERDGTGWDLNLIDSAASQKMLATWYTYDAQKRPVWLTTLPNQIQTLSNGERVWWSPLMKSTWNNNAETRNALLQVGEVSLRFLPQNPTRAVVRWRWNLVSSLSSHDECISDLIRAGGNAQAPAPDANAAYSGVWHEPSYDGYGYQVVIAPTSNGHVELASLTAYDQTGEPAWLSGQRSRTTSSTPSDDTLDLKYSVSPFPSGFPTSICSASSSCTEDKRPAGTLRRTFSSPSAATAVISANYNGLTGQAWQSIQWNRPPTGQSGAVDIRKIAAVDQVLINRSHCNLGSCPVDVQWASHSNHFDSPRVYRRRLDGTGGTFRVPVNTSTGQYSDTLTQAGRYRYELKQWDHEAAPNLALSIDIVASAATSSGPEIPPAPIADPAFSTDSSSNVTGATRGEFRVDESGAANYTIPLMTVPGSGNMAPEMALSYSSRGGSGVLGAGWQITGQSAISRCAQATEHGDPRSIAITLSDTDRFCLDGQRLIVIQGAYGAAGSIYRLETDQLVRVTAEGNLGGAPTQFTRKPNRSLLDSRFVAHRD